MVDSIVLGDRQPDLRRVGRAHVRKIAKVGLVGDEVLSRLKVKDVLHERIRELSKGLNLFRRCECDPLAFKRPSSSELTVCAHKQSVGCTVDAERSGSRAASRRCGAGC